MPVIPFPHHFRDSTDLNIRCRNFASSINFNGSGQFINPTRDSIKAVLKENDRLVIPGTGTYKRPAIFLTTGVVHTCNIVTPTFAQKDRVKRLQVIPMAHEYERLLGWFGLCFGKRQLYAYVTPDIALTFATRKEASTAQGS
jgi:hypothetical protein